MANQPGKQRNRYSFPKPPSRDMLSLEGEMSDETKKMAVRYQFIYSILGLLLGLMCMILGTFLFFKGIQGSSTWSAKILGMDSKISDAGPGVMLFIVGLFSIYVTRFGIRNKK